MTISRNKARRLCTADEYLLVESSMKPAIDMLDSRTLRHNLALLRRLRDKFRRQGDRRQREMQGKAEPRGRQAATLNVLTDAKARLFSESCQRIEARLHDIEVDQAHQAQVASARAALAARKAAEGHGVHPASGHYARAGMRVHRREGGKGTFPAPGSIRGEVSAWGKRRQAVKDSRG